MPTDREELEDQIEVKKCCSGRCKVSIADFQLESDPKG